MSMQTLAATHRLVWISLMAALTAVGAWLHFPLLGVPFSMQPFFTMLAGLVLGPVHGALAVGLYLLAGAVGLPVFAGGASGFAHVMGPTGGYLVGFVLGAATIGMSTRERGAELPWRRGIAWGLLAYAVVYGLGAAWLKSRLGIDWIKTLTIGVLPFLIGDAAKLVLAVATYRHLRAKRLLPA